MAGLRFELTIDAKGIPFLRQVADEARNAGDRLTESFTRPQDAQGRFTTGAQGASGALDKLSGFAGGARDKLEGLAGTLGNAAVKGAALAAGFLGFQGAVASVNAATSSVLSFDKELANVNTVLTGSGVSIKQLEQQILLLPPSLGSATELTKGLYQALSAGVEPAKAVGFVAEQAKLASSGLTDLSTTVKVSTAAMDAFQLSSDQASHISDVLFTVVQRGKTEFDPLAKSIAQVFPLAKSLGLSFEDTAATVTTLTKVFPTTSEAITGFRSLLSNVTGHLDDFRAAGVRVNEVISQRGMTGLIEELARITGQSAEVLKARFIPDVEGSTAALALMGPQLQAQKDNVQAFSNVVGANSTAFEKQQASISSALDRIKTGIERIFLGGSISTLGKALLEPIEQWVILLGQGGQASVEFAQVATASLSGITGALGLVIQSGAKVIEGWQRIGQAVATVGSFYFDTLDTLTVAANKLGLVSDEEASRTLANYAKQSLGIRQMAIDLGAAADETAKFGDQVQAKHNAIQQSIAAAGERAREFAHSLAQAGVQGEKAGQQITQGAIQSGKAIAATAQTTLPEVAKATQDVVTGIVSYWKDGEQQIIEVHQRIAQGGTQGAINVDEAFNKLGISTRDTLQNLATDALARFSAIERSGRATPLAILDQWKKTQQQIIEAGFKKLPEGYEAEARRVEDLARQNGLTVEKIYIDRFGNIRLGIQQTILPAFQLIDNAIKGIGAASGDFTQDVASNFGKAFERAQIESNYQLGLINQTTRDLKLSLIDTGEEGGRGLAQGIQKGVRQANDSLSQFSATIDLTGAHIQGFTIPFSDDIVTLKQQLADTQKQLAEFDGLRFGPVLTSEAFDESFKQQLEVFIRALQKRIAQLEQENASLFGTEGAGQGAEGGGGTGSIVSVGTGGGAPTLNLTPASNLLSGGAFFGGSTQPTPVGSLLPPILASPPFPLQGRPLPPAPSLIPTGPGRFPGIYTPSKLSPPAVPVPSAGGEFSVPQVTGFGPPTIGGTIAGPSLDVPDITVPPVTVSPVTVSPVTVPPVTVPTGFTRGGVTINVTTMAVTRAGAQELANSLAPAIRELQRQGKI